MVAFTREYGRGNDTDAKSTCKELAKNMAVFGAVTYLCQFDITEDKQEWCVE